MTGILLRGIKREDVSRGQVLAKPGSVKPAKLFAAELYVLTKEEGGRHTPFFKKYKPQFFFRTADVTGTVILPDELEMYQAKHDRPMTLPFTNENVSAWRDDQRAIDNADFDPQFIEYDRERRKKYFLERYEKPKELAE